jgi:hypothetical protein
MALSAPVASMLPPAQCRGKATGVGILFLAWRRRRLALMATLLQIATQNRAVLIDEIDAATLKK